MGRCSCGTRRACWSLPRRLSKGSDRFVSSSPFTTMRQLLLVLTVARAAGFKSCSRVPIWRAGRSGKSRGSRTMARSSAARVVTRGASSNRGWRTCVEGSACVRRPCYRAQRRRASVSPAKATTASAANGLPRVASALTVQPGSRKPVTVALTSTVWFPAASRSVRVFRVSPTVERG